MAALLGRRVKSPSLNISQKHKASLRRPNKIFPFPRVSQYIFRHRQKNWNIHVSISAVIFENNQAVSLQTCQY